MTSPQHASTTNNKQRNMFTKRDYSRLQSVKEMRKKEIGGQFKLFELKAQNVTGNDVNMKKGLSFLLPN